MLTCTLPMELGLIATPALFLKLPFMKPISLAGITGEGKTFLFVMRFVCSVFPFSILCCEVEKY
jgi:hypothetical protein